jgi:hypothetical protein
MISVLIYVLVLLLVFGVIFYVVRSITLEEPFKTAAILVILIIFGRLTLGVVGIIPGWNVRPLG